MAGFGVMMANARARKADIPSSLSGKLRWLMAATEYALTHPTFRAMNDVLVLEAIGNALCEELKKPVPAIETFFAVTLCGVLVKHYGTTPGSENALRVQVLIAVLLPLVRVDLARAIDAERNRA